MIPRTSKVVSSSRGEFNVLRKENLAPFMEYGNVSKRLHALKTHDHLGTRATRLAAALDDGAEF